VFVDCVDWSDGRVWKGSRILGQDESLHQGCGHDVANLERFVVLLPYVEFAHYDIKFTGLIYFSMDDMKAIRTVIDTLRIPSLETRVWRKGFPRSAMKAEPHQ